MATQKQKKAIANLVGNGGNVTKAMRDAGYTEATINTPQKLTESVAFKQYADSLPDDLLLEVHLEGLHASKEVWKNNNESGEIEKVSEEPDYAVRHKYLDSAYKIKGTYAPEKKKIEGSIDIHDTEELKKIADEVEERYDASRQTSSS